MFLCEGLWWKCTFCLLLLGEKRNDCSSSSVICYFLSMLVWHWMSYVPSCSVAFHFCTVRLSFPSKQKQRIQCTESNCAGVDISHFNTHWITSMNVLQISFFYNFVFWAGHYLMLPIVSLLSGASLDVFLYFKTRYVIYLYLKLCTPDGSETSSNFTDCIHYISTNAIQMAICMWEYQFN